ncbi:MAG: RNA pyrophosphohydrolase [Rickettsiales bacterium]|nr:RNA pyrophosphohydrolase [Rickettsiales bacterium]
MNKSTININRENLPYRKCVGIMLLNKNREVFVGQRIDNKADAWQMPQGGIEDGEDLIFAAKRELLEEIGTNNIEIISQAQGWYSYDIPDYLIPKFWNGKYRGQTQMWYLANFLGEDSEININTEIPEFTAWKWSKPWDLPAIIVPFKRDLYKGLLEEFKDFL